MKDKKEIGIDELYGSIKDLNEYDKIPDRVRAEMRKCFDESVRFDEFVSYVIERLSERFSIPIEDLKNEQTKAS